MARRWVALLLGCLAIAASPAAPQDEPSIPKIVERMEAAAAETRGVAYSIPSVVRLLQACDVAADRKGNVRVRFPIPGSNTSHPLYPDRELILADGSVHFINGSEMHLASQQGYIACWAEKLTPGNCDRLEPTFLPILQYPAGMANSEHAYGIFFFLFAPRQALAFERDVRLLGKRTLGGEECWVLRCEKNVLPPYAFVTKKIFVRTRDHKLHALRMTTSFPQGHAGQSGWTVRYGKDGAPVAVDLTHEGGSYRQWNTTWDLAAARRAAPAPIQVPDDLYATHFRFPDLQERLKNSPEEPELLASVAFSTGRTEDWERAFAKRPGIAPTVNLIRRYEREQARPRVVDLLRGIRRDTAAEPVLVEAARVANGIGEFDLAFSFVEGAKSDLAVAQRAVAWAGKSDAVRAVNDLVPMIVRPERPFIPFHLFPLNRSKPVDDAPLKRLREAADAHPASSAIRLVLFIEALRLRRFPDAGTAFREFLALKPPVDQMKLAMNLFAGFAYQVSRARDAELQTLTEGARELLTKLEPVHAECDVRQIRLQLLEKLNDVRGVEDEAGKLMDALQKGDVANKWLAYDLLKDIGTEPQVARAKWLYIDSLKGRLPLEFHRLRQRLWDHPLFEFAQERLKQGDHLGLLQGIRSIPLEFPLGQYGATVFTCLQARDPDLAKLGTEALGLSVREDKESAVELLAWSGRLLETVSRSWPRRDHLPATKQIYTRLRELAPDSWPALEGLIRVAVHDRDIESAKTLVGEAVGRGARGQWNAARLHVLLAHAHFVSGDTPPALVELKKMDLSKIEIDPPDAWRAAQILDQAGEPALAAAFVERMIEDGMRPFVRLAQLHLKAGRADRALRVVDRAMGVAWAGQFIDADYLYMGDPRVLPEPVADLRELRENVLAGDGWDESIREWLAKPRDALSPEDETRARAAAGKLGHEENAMKVLSDLGPKCAALVLEAYKTGTPEGKRRAKKLLVGWVTESR